MALDYWILDRRGSPARADLDAWSLAQETDPRWHVASDECPFDGGWVRVDTCFLGFDPRPFREERTGQPVLWDSAVVFFTDKEADAGERIAQRFYRSRAAALWGHAQLLQLIVAGNLGGERGNGHLT